MNIGRGVVQMIEPSLQPGIDEVDVPRVLLRHALAAPRYMSHTAGFFFGTAIWPNLALRYNLLAKPTNKVCGGLPQCCGCACTSKEETCIKHK